VTSLTLTARERFWIKIGGRKKAVTAVPACASCIPFPGGGASTSTSTLVLAAARQRRGVFGCAGAFAFQPRRGGTRVRAHGRRDREVPPTVARSRGLLRCVAVGLSEVWITKQEEL